MNYQDRITRDQNILGGQAVLRGTRVTLKTVLASLAEGATTAEILADFPTLSEDDVRAAIAFAAASAQEDLRLAEILSPRPMNWRPHLESGPVASEAFMANVEKLPWQEREP